MATTKQNKLLHKILEEIKNFSSMNIDDKVEIYNEISLAIKDMIGLEHPVLSIQLIKNDKIKGNEYNPNVVAPPEYKLLELSILQDGYTQPIVVFDENKKEQDDKPFEVVDGFHRTKVGKENKEIIKNTHGYLPCVVINKNRSGKADRMVSTVAHNRARGKHTVNAMSDIVVELKKRNWSDEKIGTQLGMSPDEVLRLSQISGLSELFQNKEFSKAWEPKFNDN